MSNIIKGGRIRSQGYLDLSQRLVPDVEKVHEEVWDKTDETQVSDSIDELTQQKKEALSLLEAEIQKKMEDADEKVEAMLAEAIMKSQSIEKEAKDKQTAFLAEMQQKQSEIIEKANEEAEQIKASAYNEKQQMLEAVEGEVVDTVIEIVQHIISEELVSNVSWLKLVVRKMMLADQASDTFRLLVSPHNMQKIEENHLDFMQGISKVTDIAVDERLNDTSCILETSQGNIEYDVSAGLEKVIKELRILKSIS